MAPEPQPIQPQPTDAAPFGETDPRTVLPEPRFSGLVVGSWGGCVDVDRKQLWCWGAELRDRSADLPPFEAAPIDDGRLQLHRAQRCFVRDGELGCEQEQPLGLGEIVDVEGDSSEGCSARKDGEVRCWGRTGDPAELGVRGVIEGVVDVEMFAGGVCVRTEAGRIACPGGKLRDGQDAPLALVEGVDQVTELELGRFHGCLIHRAGRVQCFGWNGWGQLGVGDTRRHEGFVDVKLPGPATELAVSDNHSCAIANDQVLCWGADEIDGGRPHFGQTEIDLDATVLHVERSSSCATRPDGALWCWGVPQPSSTPIDGWGGAVRAATPTAVASPRPVTEFHSKGIRSGDEFILMRSYWPLALDGDEDMRIHGVAGFATDGHFLTCVFGGAAGFRCIDDEQTPVRAAWVPRLRDVSAMTISFGTMCAVHGGRVSCLHESEPRWVRIPGLRNIRSVVDDGDDRACALAADGRIGCWRGGTDDHGRYRVGEGPYLLGERDVVEIAWGWELLARTRLGALRSGPGIEPDEQLDTLIDDGVLEVAGAPDFIGVPGHACARVDRDGDGSSERIACFGDDRMGQLGRLGEHVHLRPRSVEFPGLDAR